MDSQVAAVVEAEVEGSVAHLHFVRNSAPILRSIEVAVGVVGPEPRSRAVRDADLRSMRAGNVGKRGAVVPPQVAKASMAQVVAVPVPCVGVVPHGRPIPGIRRGAVLPRVVGIARRGRAVPHPGRPGRGRRSAVLVGPDALGDSGRMAGLEEHPAVEGRSPFRGRRVVQNPPQPARRGGHVGERIVRRVAVLEDPIEIRGELVDRTGPVGQSQQGVGDGVLVDPGHPRATVAAVEPDRGGVEETRRDVGLAVEAVGDLLVDLHVAEAAEEPQRVADQRAALPDVEVVKEVDALGPGHTPLDGPGRETLETVRLPPVDAAAEIALAAEGIAPFTRDHVHAHPAARCLRGYARGFVYQLLAGQMVVIGLARPVEIQAVHDLPVDPHGRLRRAHPVDRHEGLLRRRRQAHLRAVQLDADDQLRRRLQVVPGRNRVENRTVEHLGPSVRAHVDDRRRAGNRDRLLEPAYGEFPVYRHREPGRQIQSFPNDGREPRQREGQRVVARAQIDQRVAAGSVRDRDAGTLDERRARRLDGCAGENAPGVVRDPAGEGAVGLTVRGPGRQHDHAQGRHYR